MPINYFIGKDQAWLEAELAKAQADFSAGKTLVSVHAGDVSSAKQVQVDVRVRMEQLLYALYLLDPVKYPADQIRRTTVTVARFRDT